MTTASEVVTALNQPGRLVRESLSVKAVRAIREAILDGTYALGQKLRESELVARFGVSSSVIREALHLLQGEGIIVTRPYCGRSVFNMSANEAAELIVMRTSLESYAAYLAAQKMTPAAAEKILAAAGRFVEERLDSYSGWVDLELGIHSAIWEASQNEWLIRQLNQFSVPVFALRLVKGTKRKDGDVHTLWDSSLLRETSDNPRGHQALAHAVTAGDPREARRMMVLHIFPEPEQMHQDLFHVL